MGGGQSRDTVIKGEGSEGIMVMSIKKGMRVTLGCGKRGVRGPKWTCDKEKKAIVRSASKREEEIHRV